MSEEKKTVWQLDVTRMSSLKVVFAEPVSAEDAKILFDDEDYEDIIDEEDHGVEVVGVR